MQPVTIPPWRVSPFTVGSSYRVRHDFTALRDAFHQGDVLTFVRDAYSRYDGCTGYFFTQAGAQNLRVWDIFDDDDLAVWHQHFEAADTGEQASVAGGL